LDLHQLTYAQHVDGYLQLGIISSAELRLTTRGVLLKNVDLN
jgi:hypothetical protein